MYLYIYIVYVLYVYVCMYVCMYVYTSTMPTRPFVYMYDMYVCMCQAEHLVLSAGCAAVLVQLSLLLFNAGDSVLVPAPYYPAFDHDFRNLGQGSTTDRVHVCMYVCNVWKYLHLCYE